MSEDGITIIPPAPQVPPEPIGVPPEATTSEPPKVENGLEAPPMAPEAPRADNPPAPAETLLSTPEPVEPPSEPLPPVTPIVVLPQVHPRSFLTKALESIQFRKRAKLEKIIRLVTEKHTITNDQVEKLLHVSDATATRYLAQLVREGRLRKVGPDGRARYELVSGSVGGN